MEKPSHLLHIQMKKGLQFQKKQLHLSVVFNQENLEF